ncbi:MMPL family transporter [Alteribacter keqinensis]|uniref:MMPL family transporter n=1 Tax=Alteribacter keqinensis TaxID=2483800 RepID=A0A3M7TX94_9BACI|nr:MMPL family transporter [Alteribacter keqinensis]RNA70240.1 MMPL family transporter [Alteribacter keqinensis]
MKKLIYILPLMWIAAAVFLFLQAPNMDELVRERGQASIPEEYPSQTADQIMKENEGTTGETVLVVYRSETSLTEGELERIEETLTEVGPDIGGFQVHEVVTPFDSEESEDLLLSEDGTTILAFVQMDMDFSDVAAIRDDLAAELESPGVDTLISGSSVIEDDVIISSEEGLATTEVITVIFVLIILLLVFRSLAAPLVPLVTVGASYVVSVGIVSYLIDSFNFPVSNFTQIFIVAVLFGIGTDYCILLLNRFKAELIEEKGNRFSAMKRTFKAVGPTVFSSALTGFIGFFAIGFAGFDLYRSAMGVSIGIIVLVAAIWVWVPLAMLLLGEKLYWPSRAGLKPKPSRTWGALGRFAVFRPGWTLVLLGLLIIPAILSFDNATSFNSLDEIGSEFDSVEAFQVVEEKFGEGDMFPATVTLANDEPWDTQTWLPYIEALTRELEKIDGVKEVRSATQPNGEIVDAFRIPVIAEEVADGLNETNNGIEDIQEGLEQLAGELRESGSTEGLEELQTGSEGLAEGARDLESGLNEMEGATRSSADGARELGDGVQNIQNGLADAANALPPEIAAELETLIGGLLEIEENLSQLSSGVAELASAQNELGTGAGELAGGADEIATGQREVAEAFSDVEDGFREIADALEEINDGLGEIQEGLREMEDVLSEIASQPQNPMEGFFVPEEALASDDFNNVWDNYTTPNRLVTTIDVVFELNPYSNEAMDTIDVIEERTRMALKGTQLEGTPVAVAGLSSINRDLQTISNDDFFRTATIMLIGIFIVLVVLLKSLVMPVYILISLILTYFLSVSFTEFFFVTILGYSGITWAVPFFGFIMLMALGVDYSIFLTARFQEDIKNNVDIKETILYSMEQIGTVVLSAAVILAGTFGAMMPSGVLSLMQIGTLVLTGLLLYAVIMLPLFIPVMIVLFGEKNWWPGKRPVSVKE